MTIEALVKGLTRFTNILETTDGARKEVDYIRALAVDTAINGVGLVCGLTVECR